MGCCQEPENWAELDAGGLLDPGEDTHRVGERICLDCGAALVLAGHLELAAAPRSSYQGLRAA